MPKKKAAEKRPKTKAKGKPSNTSASKKSARGRAQGADFASTFVKLKALMAAFASQLRVIDDAPGKYQLVTKANSWRGGPMFFGAVIMGKAYVSYHLMPLYVCRELAANLSPDLKKRMHGKSCFNFREPDPRLFTQLRDLTKAGLQAYRAKKCS